MAQQAAQIAELHAKLAVQQQAGRSRRDFRTQRVPQVESMQKAGSLSS